MNKKEHILSALKEQFHSWKELLAGLSEEQITTPHVELDWSIQDVMAHLWAWQQMSIARMEAGVQDREPVFIENWEDNADRVNALTYETHHEKSWSEIYQNWRKGFLHFLKSGAEISERNLLDGDTYSWLKGHSLAAILIAAYDHHQEHLEKTRAWLHEQRND